MSSALHLTWYIRRNCCRNWIICAVCHRQIYWKPWRCLASSCQEKTFVEAKSCSSLASVTRTSARTVLSQNDCCERNRHPFLCWGSHVDELASQHVRRTLSTLFYLFAFLHLFVSLHFILLVYFFITNIFLLFVSIYFLNFLMPFCPALFNPSFYSSKLFAHSSVYITL